MSSIAKNDIADSKYMQVFALSTSLLSENCFNTFKGQCLNWNLSGNEFAWVLFPILLHYLQIKLACTTLKYNWQYLSQNLESNQLGQWNHFMANRTIKHLYRHSSSTFFYLSYDLGIPWLMCALSWLIAQPLSGCIFLKATSWNVCQ